LAVGFPPEPLYPFGIDSDYTLYLVRNTTEAPLAADNQPFAEEIQVVPVGAHQAEVWPDNGFATVEGELFYYDSVARDGNGKVWKLKRCARNLGGDTSRLNRAGVFVRGFVVAEHHNQLVDAVIRVEGFVGYNFTPDKATLDWRIRNLRALPVIFDDHSCPDINFRFDVVEDDPASGVLAQYEIVITGSFTGFRLDFGDGTFTTESLSGTHRYAPNSQIDPIITVSNDQCQVVQSPIERDNPTEPTEGPGEPTFEIPIPEIPDFPDVTVPSLVIPDVRVNIPPVTFPCLDIGPIGPFGPINVPSLITVDIPDINIPSEILFVGVPSFGPIEIVGPSFGPIEIVVPSLAPVELVLPSLAPIELVGFSLSPISIVGPSFSPISIVGPSFSPITIVGPSFSPIEIVGPSLTPISIVPPVLTPIFVVPPSLTPIFVVPPSLTPIFVVPPNIPTVITFGPVPVIPSIINFGPAPNLPTVITFGPAPPMPTTINFGPAPAIPTLINFGPAPPMPTTINFGPAPAIPTVITFGPAPSIAPVTFGPAPSIAPVTFGPAPSIAPVTFGPAPTVNVNWGTPPTVTCTVTVSCPASSMAMGPALTMEDRMAMGLEARSFDPYNDALTVDVGDIGIPSEIKVLAPEMRDIRLVHDLPPVIELRAPNIPTEINIRGPEVPIPTEIKVINAGIPEVIALSVTNMPSTIALDATNVPTSIPLVLPDGFPRSLTLDASGVPSTIQVVGVPSTIELVGVPDFITLKFPEEMPSMELVYKGAPIDVKISLDIQKLTGQDDPNGPPCVMIVPCPAR
jgi:hypothetical protein